MTLGEFVENAARDMAMEACTNEEKGKVLEELESIVSNVQNGEKIDLGKLFDATDKFVKAFPEYSSSLFALCLLGGTGAQNMEITELNDVPNMELNDFVEGINIEGEE